MMKSVHVVRAFQVLTIVFLATFLFSCASLDVKAGKAPLPSGSSVVVVVDCDKDVQNKIMSVFMQQGYRVKAFNATDLYTVGVAKDLKVQQPYQREVERVATLQKIREAYDARFLVMISLNSKSSPFVRVIDLQVMELAYVEAFSGSGDPLDRFLSVLTGMPSGKKK